MAPPTTTTEYATPLLAVPHPLNVTNTLSYHEDHETSSSSTTSTTTIKSVPTSTTEEAEVETFEPVDRNMRSKQRVRVPKLSEPYLLEAIMRSKRRRRHD